MITKKAAVSFVKILSFTFTILYHFSGQTHYFHLREVWQVHQEAKIYQKLHQNGCGVLGTNGESQFLNYIVPLYRDHDLFPNEIKFCQVWILFLSFFPCFFLCFFVFLCPLLCIFFLLLSQLCYFLSFFQLLDFQQHDN